MPRKKKITRLPVSRERALDVAIAIADAEGLEALTMRRLAKELKVEAMSLYHHVANKDAILDGNPRCASEQCVAHHVLAGNGEFRLHALPSGVQAELDPG